MREALATQRSLGLTDPYSVAWDLLPFSFIADWFIPIGTYLDNYNIIPNISAEFLQIDKHVWEGQAYGKLCPYVGAVSTAKQTIIYRSKLASFVPVKPEFSLPKSSTTHFWSSLALLRQKLD